MSSHSLTYQFADNISYDYLLDSSIDIGTMKFQISVGLRLFFSQVFANPYGLIPHPTIIKFWTFCFSLLLFRALWTFFFTCEEKPRLNLPSYQEKTYMSCKLKSKVCRYVFSFFYNFNNVSTGNVRWLRGQSITSYLVMADTSQKASEKPPNIFVTFFPYLFIYWKPTIRKKEKVGY